MSAQQNEIPVGIAQDNDYVSRTGQNEVPVQKDDAPVNDPYDAATADSDEQLRTLILLLVLIELPC